MYAFNLSLAGKAASALELGTRIHAILEANPDLVLEHSHFFNEANERGFGADVVGVAGTPLPAVTGGAEDTSTPAAPVEKPKRGRGAAAAAPAKTPAQQAAAGTTEPVTDLEGLLQPLQHRVKSNDKGVVCVTEAIYFHAPKNNTAYALLAGEPLVIMSGAVEVTQEEHDRLKAEYSAAYAKTGAADAGNAAAGAAEPTSSTPTPGATTEASASASAGDASPSDVPAEKPITDEDLRALSNAAVQAGKRNDVLALVKKYAIEAISKCPAEKRPQLKKDLEALAPATEDAALA